MAKQDPDVKVMSIGKLRRELMRVRRALRRHRDAEGNARCWHNDVQLYARTLPEAATAGRMDLPEHVLLKKCKHYIRRQKCDATICPHTKTARR